MTRDGRPVPAPRGALAAVAVLLGCAQPASHGAQASREDAAVAAAARVVDEVIPALMHEHRVPGIAVAVVAGERRSLFPFGVASLASRRPVDASTLFEIGSVSKLFTGALGAYAVATGAWSLDDPASAHAEELRGTAFDAVPVRELATYTAGGLPLQFPAGIDGLAATFAWYRAWRPRFEPGTTRVYSNPSIGLFGHLAAASLRRPFDEVMERTVFPALGLRDTFLHVPAARAADYADGHARDGSVVRVSPGPFAAEAYGVKTTALDLARFVAANVGAAGLDPTLQRTIALTHEGLCRSGAMTQALGWETYSDPHDLDALLTGNSPAVTAAVNPIERFPVPRALAPGALCNKTGATNGFSAYVVGVPDRRTGVVLLANAQVPAAARIRAAHRILAELLAPTR